MKPKLRRGQWSLDHERCTQCGRTDRPHKARGLCASCYAKPYAAESYKKLIEDETPRDRKSRLRARAAYKKTWRAGRRASGRKPS